MSLKFRRWSPAAILVVLATVVLGSTLFSGHSSAVFIPFHYSFNVTVKVTLTGSNPDITQLPTTDSVTVSGTDQGSISANQSGQSNGNTVTYTTSNFTGTAPTVGAVTLKVCDSVLNQCVNTTEPGTTSVAITGSTASPGNGGGGGGTNGGGSANSPPTCEGTAGPLGWILCGVFNLVGDATQWMLQNVIQPFLATAPIATSGSSSAFTVWSNFRVYGDIFLVIALLVVVFGQSIGGGIIDAYTAKKVLPRLLIAAILINLSIYIVALLVDITNVLGQGIGNLVTEPLRQCTPNQAAVCWNFTITGTQIAGVFSVGLIGLLASLGTLVGVIGGIFFGGLSAASTGITAAFFVAIPMLLAILAVFVTLLLRKGIILLLLLVSPVAFALYCLPNTEQYFRKWWEALVKTLMVYPLIMLIFAVSDLLSVTILQSNGVTPAHLQDTNWIASHAGSVLAIIMAFFAQFLPLLIIPFSFRIAGGILGRVHELTTAAGTRVNKMAEGRRQIAKQQLSDASVQYRQKRAAGLDTAASKGGFVRRKGLGFLSSRIGGYNIEAEASAARARNAKEVNDQIATGIDGEPRGLTVNKDVALAGRHAIWKADRDNGVGVPQGGWVDQNGTNMNEDEAGASLFRVDSDGKRQFKTLGGAWVDEMSVDRAHQRWGRNTFAQQAALAYEMRKAQDEGQLQQLGERYQSLALGSWGMDEQQAGGSWIGAAFEHQNQHLEYKYTDWKTGKLKNPTGFVDEIYEKRGSYPLSQMSSNTIEQLKQAYSDTQDEDTRKKISAIAESFMHDMSVGGTQVGVQGETPITTTPEALTGAGGGGRLVSAPGAAHVAERVTELAQMTGVLHQAPTVGERYPPTHDTKTPPPPPGNSSLPNQRSQSGRPLPGGPAATPPTPGTAAPGGTPPGGPPPPTGPLPQPPTSPDQNRRDGYL